MRRERAASAAKTPAKTRHARRTNLPAPIASFHGRGEERAQLEAAFERGRLVSIVGPGGMGKTRLSLEYAADRVAVFGRRARGGVWFVDLSDARTADDAASTVASALDLRAGAGADRVEAVGRAIAGLGPTLVVLDNLEQLEGAAALTSRWMALAPSARLLVTTRVVLGVPGEHVLTLGPLAPSDAIALFVARARDVRTPSADEAMHVERVVAAIDRMPLAIELAASRTRSMSTEALGARLARPSTVLSGDASHRHGSLRRTVLDSVALLSPVAARAFALLSVLRNGFDLVLAEAVLGPLALGPGPTIDALDALVRSSLLRSLGPSGYAFFETIREIADERLADEPLAGAAREAFVTHHAAIDADVLAGDGARENAIEAARIAIALGRPDAALTIALALDPHLSRRGEAALRVRLLSGGLALEPTAPSLRALAHLARGAALRELGDGPRASDDFEAAHRIATDVGDVGLRASALMRLGGIRDLRGDTAGAREHLRSALRSIEALPAGRLRRAREAEALSRLGHAQRREGALDDARAAIARAVSLHRELGDAEGLAAALYELGVIAMFRAEHERAFQCFDEGLAVSRERGVRVMEGACLTARGGLLQDLGRLDEALTHHAEAAAIFRDHGITLRQASALHYLACTYLERGEPAAATEPLVRARALLEGVGSPRYEVLTRCAWAVALSELGRHDEADAVIAPADRALQHVPNEPALALALRLHRATLTLRRGGEAQVLGDEEATAAVERAGTDDSRFALRTLQRARAGEGVRSDGAGALRVWGEGEAFQPPHRERIALPARSPLRRVLLLLVDRREHAPGEPTSLEQVIAAGWPGEKIGADAALNRAYVAIATLRKRGLSDAIVSVGGGYAISMAIPIRRVDERSGS